MVDAMVVGQIVGVKALAAVGAADWIIWMVQGIVSGGAQGFSILTSQNYGAGKAKELRRTVAGSYTLNGGDRCSCTGGQSGGSRPVADLS